MVFCLLLSFYLATQVLPDLETIFLLFYSGPMLIALHLRSKGQTRVK